MEFTQLEREKITDGFLSIQSAENSLSGVDDSKIPELEAIQTCLRNADRTLRRVLRSSPVKKS